MSQSLRIVVADDEPDLRDYFRRILPLLGHQVVALATNGHELVERCRQTQPDLVITDIHMPELDGIEAAVRIYQNQPLPIILIAAHLDPETVERAAADHVLGFLVKPIKQGDLLPAIALARRCFEQLTALQQEAVDLREALMHRAVVDQAVNLLRKSTGEDEESAFRRLQSLARTRHLKLATLAAMLVEGEEVFQAKGE